MRRSALSTTLLVIALLVASCQCVLTCTSDEPVRQPQSTEQKVPPCHGHQPSEDDTKGLPCAHSPVVAEERGSATSSQLSIPIAANPLIGLPAALFAPLISGERVAVQNTPPPGLHPLLRFTVLRV